MNAIRTSNCDISFAVRLKRYKKLMRNREREREKKANMERHFVLNLRCNLKSVQHANFDRNNHSGDKKRNDAFGMIYHKNKVTSNLFIWKRNPFFPLYVCCSQSECSASSISGSCCSWRVAQKLGVLANKLPRIKIMTQPPHKVLSKNDKYDTLLYLKHMHQISQFFSYSLCSIAVSNFDSLCLHLLHVLCLSRIASFSWMHSSTKCDLTRTLRVASLSPYYQSPIY